MTQHAIYPGGIYWIGLDGVRIRVRAVEATRNGEAWWRCADQHGTELMIPEPAFLEECRDAVGFAAVC
jgi:hypothetical protein